MTKHNYTEAEAPTNTGSLTRPARFNLRLTCQDRARTHRALAGLREIYGMEPDATFADVWADHGLLIIEHFVRTITNGETDIAEFMKRQGRPLPLRDYVRNRNNRNS